MFHPRARAAHDGGQDTRKVLGRVKRPVVGFWLAETA